MEDTKSKDYLNSDCENCARKGFTWARGYCQYCGHRQFEDALFVTERDERELLNAEAVEQYQVERKRKGGGKGDGADGCDGWDFFDGDGGDCGGDGGD